jgi:hypothetical protein
MRNKIAKALRKELKYKISSKEKANRVYKTLTMPSTRKHTLQFNWETGEMKAVRGSGNSELIECVSGDRKMYKYLKNKYKNFNHEESLSVLPNQKELDELQAKILKEMHANKGESNE